MILAADPVVAAASMIPKASPVDKPLKAGFDLLLWHQYAELPRRFAGKRESKAGSK